jgi:hypothetical protein
MQVRAANRLRFEEFDLDVGCRTLRRAGRRPDLRPRSFHVPGLVVKRPTVRPSVRAL